MFTSLRDYGVARLYKVKGSRKFPGTPSSEALSQPGRVLNSPPPPQPPLGESVCLKTRIYGIGECRVHGFGLRGHLGILTPLPPPPPPPKKKKGFGRHWA